VAQAAVCLAEELYSSESGPLLNQSDHALDDRLDTRTHESWKDFRHSGRVDAGTSPWLIVRDVISAFHAFGGGVSRENLRRMPIRTPGNGSGSNMLPGGLQSGNPFGTMDRMSCLSGHGNGSRAVAATCQSITSMRAYYVSQSFILGQNVRFRQSFDNSSGIIPQTIPRENLAMRKRRAHH
jgi:hypothetical protein